MIITVFLFLSVEYIFSVNKDVYFIRYMYDSDRPAKRQKMMDNKNDEYSINSDFQSNIFFNIDVKYSEETLDNFLELYSEKNSIFDENSDKKNIFKNLLKEIVFERSFRFCTDPTIPLDIKKTLGTRITVPDSHYLSHKTGGVVFYIDTEYLFLFDVNIAPSFDNKLNIIYDIFSHKY